MLEMHERDETGLIKPIKDSNLRLIDGHIKVAKLVQASLTMIPLSLGHLAVERLDLVQELRFSRGPC